MFPILGVDIGKDALYVCAAHTHQNAPQWHVTTIEYTDPAWHEKLMKLVLPGAIVAAEPTGYHYLQPLVTVLSWIPGVQLWQVNHRVTGLIREAEIAASKTDHMDARALAFIAARIMKHDAPRGVRRYLTEREDAAQQLRLVVNTYRRLTKDTTRLKNQLDAIGHSIWPALVIYKATWMRCLSLNAVSPIEIIALADEPTHDLADGRIYRSLRALADMLPPIDCTLHARAAVLSLHNRLEGIDREKGAASNAISALIEAPPLGHITSKWRTIPGIGDLYIAALHVATRGQADLLTRDEFKACVGVSPRTERSSSIDRTGRKKRKGYKPAMAAIYLMTNNLLSPSGGDNSIKRYKVSHPQLKRPAAACRRKLGDILSAIAQRPDGAWRG